MNDCVSNSWSHPPIRHFHPFPSLSIFVSVLLSSFFSIFLSFYLPLLAPSLTISYLLFSPLSFFKRTQRVTYRVATLFPRQALRWPLLLWQVRCSRVFIAFYNLIISSLILPSVIFIISYLVLFYLISSYLIPKCPI